MTTEQQQQQENELEIRRRVHAATEDLSDLLKDMGDRVHELHDLGVPAEEWLQLVARHAPDIVGKLYQRYGGTIGGLIDGYLDSRKANATSMAEGVAAAVSGAIGRDVRRMQHEREAPPTVIGDDNSDMFYTFEGTRMRAVIERLFDQAPKLTDAKGAPDPNQAPALECTVILKAGGQLMGAMSTTPEGSLRMLCANKMDGKPVMLEHFFDYEQVADVVLVRQMTASSAGGSGIITS